MLCPICLGEIDKSFILLNCYCNTTCFHINCINEWFKINKTCPSCNYKFKTKKNFDRVAKLKRALFFDSIGQFNRFYNIIENL